MQEGEVTHQLSLVSSQSLTLTSLRHGNEEKNILKLCSLNGAYSITLALLYSPNYPLHQISC